MKQTRAISPHGATILTTCGLFFGVFLSVVTAPATAATPATAAPAAEAPAACTGPKKEPPFDINSASALDLRCGLGSDSINEATANKIVELGPYKTVDELLDRRVLNSTMFQKIQARLTARQPAAKPK